MKSDCDTDLLENVAKEMPFQTPTLELVKKIQDGDRDAGDLLCNRYGNKVLQEVRKALGPSIRSNLDSQDIKQTVWLQIIELLPDFAYKDEISFLKWISTIVQHKIISKVRYYNRKKRSIKKETKREVDSVQDKKKTPSKCVIEYEDADLLWIALNNIPIHYRDILIDRTILNLPWDSIARVNGTNIHAAQVLMTRARDSLKKELSVLQDRGN